MNDEWKNVNDVIYAIAKRARELTNESMDELRQRCSTSIEGSLHAARQELLGVSKGELVEIVLIEEFVEEFPKNIEDD